MGKISTSKKQQDASRGERDSDEQPPAKKTKQVNWLWIFVWFGKISTPAFSNNSSLSIGQNKIGNSDKGPKVRFIWNFFWIGKIDSISSLINIISIAIFSYKLNQDSLQSQQHMAGQILRHQQKKVHKVSYCGNFSKMKKFPDSTNKFIIQPGASMSPGQKVNRSKTLFDRAFWKEPWLVHPSIIPFLTPMDVREARVEEETVH